MMTVISIFRPFAALWNSRRALTAKVTLSRHERETEEAAVPAVLLDPQASAMTEEEWETCLAVLVSVLP